MANSPVLGKQKVHSFKRQGEIESQKVSKTKNPNRSSWLCNKDISILQVLPFLIMGLLLVLCVMVVLMLDVWTYWNCFNGDFVIFISCFGSPYWGGEAG